MHQLRCLWRIYQQLHRLRNTIPVSYYHHLHINWQRTLCLGAGHRSGGRDSNGRVAIVVWEFGAWKNESAGSFRMWIISRWCVLTTFLLRWADWFTSAHLAPVPDFWLCHKIGLESLSVGDVVGFQGDCEDKKGLQLKSLGFGGATYWYSSTRSRVALISSPQLIHLDLGKSKLCTGGEPIGDWRYLDP